MIDGPRYLEALRALRTEELKLFEDARNTQFSKTIEREYWHRSRLKFPSVLAQELTLEESRR